VSIILAFFSKSPQIASADELKPLGFNTYQLVTGDDTDGDRRHWDRVYNTGKYIYGKTPATFLQENIALLPLGTALDIAMGEGRNSVYLAKKGFYVDGVDISSVAIRKAKLLARENHTTIHATTADLQGYTIRPESYEVILNIDFLLRSLVPEIKRGLKHGGVVVFENATVDQLSIPGSDQVRRDYLLERGELREMFQDFQILVYRETNDGKTAKASLIARKP
jgi:SAM-dependent methyltransferase